MVKRLLSKKQKILFVFIPPSEEIQQTSASGQFSFVSVEMNENGELETAKEINSVQINIKAKNSHRLVLVLASSEVNIMLVKCPRLSDVDLELALPNLAEEHLLTDPTDTFLLSGGRYDNKQVVLAYDKKYAKNIEKLIGIQFTESVYFLPEQLSIPEPESENLFARVTNHDKSKTISLRSGNYDFFCFSVKKQKELNISKKIVALLLHMIGGKQLTLQVPNKDKEEFRAALENISPNNIQISLEQENLTKNLSKSIPHIINFSSFLGEKRRSHLNFSKWRSSLTLALSLLIINSFALYLYKSNLDQEVSYLNAETKKLFLKHFPDETVILDPVRQMRQKIDQNYSTSLSTPDGFINLLTGLGELRETLSTSQIDDGDMPGILSVEYRNKNLFVHFEKNQKISLENKTNIFTELGLSVTESSSSDKGIIWKISNAQ